VPERLLVGRHAREADLPTALAVLVGVVALAGCAGGDRRPERLLDGSAPAPVPVELEGVQGPSVLTRVKIMRVADALVASHRLRACLRIYRLTFRSDLPVVRRVGLTGESITVREAGGRYVDGCDDSPGPREGGRAWCGLATGRLFAGRLRDPRLSLGCRTRDDLPIGFVWIEPGPGARYVMVDQPGYAEVYEVAAGLPVRVTTTTGVGVEESRATLDIAEHDEHGRLLRRARLEARVAG